MAKPRKRRRLLKAMLIILLVVVAMFYAFYHLIQSPRFIRFMINRLNQTLSGEITYDVFNIDLDHGHLEIRNFNFQSKKKEPILHINSFDARFEPIQAIRAQFRINQLRAEGIQFDQSKLEEKKVSTWRTSLRLLLKRISLTDALIDHIDITLRNGDQFKFDQATIALSPQVRNKQSLDLWVNQSFLHVGSGEIRSSTLAIQGEVEFPVLTENSFLVDKGKGSFRLAEVAINKFPATSFESEYRIDGNTLFLEKGQLHHPDGEVEINASYNPSENQYSLELKNKAPLPFTIFPKMGKEVLETFHTFDFHLKAEASGLNLEDLDGKIDLSLLVYGNTANPLTPKHELYLKGPLKDGVLSLEDFRILSAKSTVKASGKVDFVHRKFDTKVDVKDFDVETMVESLSDLDLSGYANATGTIKGDFKSPDFDFKATATQAGYSFLRFFDVVGNLKIQQGNLTYDGQVTLNGQNANVSVKTENIFKKNKITTLKTDFTDLDVSSLVANPDLKGKVTGTFELQDTSDSPPKGTLKAKITDFILLNFHLGEVQAEGQLGNQRFTLTPISFQPPNYERITLPKEAVFTFDEKGVKVTGEMLPGVSFTGDYLKSNPNRFNLEANLQNFDIRPLLAAWEIKPKEAYANGKVKIAVGLNKTLSDVSINLTEFRLPMEEAEIRNAEPIDISIKGPKISFNKVRFLAGGETFALGGTWNLDAGLDLNLNGKWNLELLKLVPQFFREGEGTANLDLKLRGTFEKPQLSGSATFNEATVAIRGVRGLIEDLTGKIALDGNSLKFESLHGLMSEGDITINGKIDLENLKPSYYDLKIDAREATVAEPGTYKLVFSGDFMLKGPSDGPVLSGKLFLTEGRYSRDFNITQFVLKAKPKTLPSEPNPYLANLKLDLSVASSGELQIKNNVAEMYLQTDLRLKGTVLKPEVLGAIEIVEGKFKYFRIDFDDAKGTIDFRESGRGPYVDVSASKEISERFATVNISVHIFGYTDNLQLNFGSDAGLEKQDILSLVFTGSLPGQGNGFSSTQVASTVLASQLGSILQGTLAEKAQLDVFRLESSDTERKNLTTLVVGKQITPRLSLEFKTDLGVDDPVQGVQAEYLIMDNLLMEASQLTDGSFDLNMTLRWRSF